jgi:diacylglycerol kinase (ATP)
MADPNQLARQIKSLRNALDGLTFAFNTQSNLKFHLVAAIGVIALGLWVGLDRIEWLIIMFTIFWVISAEMINTAIEAMVDLITQEYRQQARIAKDVAAGMVLLGALGSIVVALTLLAPKLIDKLV